MRAATVRSLGPEGGGFASAAPNLDVEAPASGPRREGLSLPHLDRGIVTAVYGSTVTLDLARGAEVSATFALALPYAACVGDELLVIGDGAEFFVIGVLAGRGKTSLELQGNVSVHAVGGLLELAGDEGVRVKGPTVEVQADKLHMVARAVVETFASLFQRVTEMLHVHAREEVSIVDEGSYRQAKTASIQTEETVTINGKEIHLG